MSTHKYDLWIVIKPAYDIPGQWVAHCLNVDVISQGNSAEHSFEMNLEAVAQVIVDDLTRNVDPLNRRAPNEFWLELHDLMRLGKCLEVKESFKRANESGTTATTIITISAFCEINTAYNPLLKLCSIVSFIEVL